MFSVIKLRDALNVVQEQTDAFVEATKEALTQPSLFVGELGYPNPRVTSSGISYALAFETTVNVEKITAKITIYLSSHESLVNFYKLKGIQVSVPELAIKRELRADEVGFKNEFKIHSITRSNTYGPLHRTAKVIPY